MAIKNRPDSTPKSKGVTDIKTEIAIARYEALRLKMISKPDQSRKR